MLRKQKIGSQAFLFIIFVVKDSEAIRTLRTGVMESMYPRVNILGLGFSAIGYLDREQISSLNICTSHTVMECFRDPDLYKIVNQSTLAATDGMSWYGYVVSMGTRGLQATRVQGEIYR